MVDYRAPPEVSCWESSASRIAMPSAVWPRFCAHPIRH